MYYMSYQLNDSCASHKEVKLNIAKSLGFSFAWNNIYYIVQWTSAFSGKSTKRIGGHTKAKPLAMPFEPENLLPGSSHTSKNGTSLHLVQK